jgi:hypothetical protein
MGLSEPKSDNIKVYMSSAERNMFEKFASRARLYLEFGCGGSTEIIVRTKASRIVSVESDKAWIDQLAQKPELETAIKAKRLHFVHADIGPVKDWGAPADRSAVDRWPRYFLAPFEKNSYDFDTVLIDGRFRVACALACHAFLKESAIVMMHDYRSRDGYSEIEKFYEIVDSAENIFAFRKKAKVNSRSFYSAVLKSMFKP